MTGTLSLLGTAGAAANVWDFTCDCDLGYRVALHEGRPRFWPRCGTGFSHTPLDAGAPCIRCGATLSLNPHAAAV